MRYLTIVALLFPWFIYVTAATFQKRADEQSTASKFRSIVAFGDSMTDNGSFDDFYAKNTGEIDPESLYSYTSANLTRSSDGPVWVEYLATSFGNSALYNFARIAASINNSLVLEMTPYDLITQVDRYLLSEAAAVPKNETIFFIYIGGNEVFDIFKLFFDETEERRQLIEQLVLSVRFNLERLYASGVQYMMFLGQLPLEDLPMRSQSTPETKAKVGELVRQLNGKFKDMIEDFRFNKPGLKIAYFDSYNFFKSLFTPEGAATNGMRTCFREPSCEGYVYYDHGHPTSYYHALIAEAIYDDLIDLEWLEETDP